MGQSALTSRRSVRLAAWQIAAITAGVACLTWLVSVPFDQRGPERVIGPFAVPVAVELIVAAAGLGAASVAVVSAFGKRRLPARSTGISLPAGALLVVAVIAATVIWRVATALGTGANIGAGLLLLSGPFVVAALLVLAVVAQRISGGLRRGFVPALILAAAVGPAFVTLIVSLTAPS